MSKFKVEVFAEKTVSQIWSVVLDADSKEEALKKTQKMIDNEELEDFLSEDPNEENIEETKVELKLTPDKVFIPDPEIEQDNYWIDWVEA